MSKPKIKFIGTPRGGGKTRDSMNLLTMKLLDLKNKESAIIPCMRGYLEAQRIKKGLERVLGNFFELKVLASKDLGAARELCQKDVGFYVLATRNE